MALYIIAYPRFAAPEERWIEKLRQWHDPQAGHLAAHVTLVFGVAGVPAEAAGAHLRAVAERTNVSTWTSAPLPCATA